MIKKCILLLLSLVSIYVCGQDLNYGLPLLNNYNAQDYQANNDNWAIEQDDRGLMYFGNSAGLLEFDGHHWRNFAPSLFAYDMHKAEDGTIYVATDNDFGYIGYKENGQTEYISLLEGFIEENEYVGTFYTVITIGDIAYFLSNRGLLYKWDENKLECITLPHPGTSRYKTLRYLNNHFYIQSPSGFAVLNDSIPETLPGGEYFEDKSIEEIFEIGQDSLMLVTRLFGLFLYTNNQLIPMNSDGSEFVKKNQVYVADQIDADNYAMGTIQNGVLVVDKEGNIRYNVNREAGMISNDHCEIFIDENKNIWSALENGITNISRNSPFTQMPEQYNIPMAKVYSMKMHNNNFFVGTAQGAYHADLTKQHSGRLLFHYVEKPGARKILDILEVDNQYILTASGTGIFSFAQNETKLITRRTFHGLEIYDENHLVGSLFTGGIGVLKKTNNSWKLHKIFTDYPGITYLNIDQQGQLWFVEDEKRVIRGKLDKTLENILLYEEVTSIPDNLNLDSVSIFQLNDQILLGTNKGTYRYVHNQFEEYHELNKAFGKPVFIDQIQYDRNQKPWFIGNDEGSVVIGNITSQADGGMDVKKFITPLHRLNDYIISMFYPYDDENIFIGTSERVIHFNSSIDHIADNQFPVCIRSVEITNANDSLLFGGAHLNNGKVDFKQPENRIPKLKFSSNALRFSYAGVFYDESKNTTFQYQLKGYNDAWSDWTSATVKEYNYLREGEYEFKVRAKNVYGVISNIDSYRFSITPPWYRTLFAYFLYMSVLVLLVYQLLVYRTKRLRKENIRLEQIVLERTSKILNQKQEIEIQNQVLSSKNKEISKQAEQLTELNGIKNQLFSIISHDLRSPLLSLITLVGMAKDKVVSEEMFRKQVDKLSARLGHTREVTENLLNWANSQMKGYKISKVKFEIADLVHDKIEFFKDQTDNKGIKVLNEIPINIFVCADKNMIELVLRNLIANAIKFCNSGDTITIQAYQSVEGLVVSIKDTGVGVDEKNRHKLFGKEFFTTAGTRKEKGSGLGLMLCKDFVELNGGRIWVESSKGEGSTFSFSMPQH